MDHNSAARSANWRSRAAWAGVYVPDLRISGCGLGRVQARGTSTGGLSDSDLRRTLIYNQVKSRHRCCGGSDVADGG
jgi:hypothetical protein